MANNFAVETTFWRWLLRGSGGRAGIRRVLNATIIVHVAVGYAIAKLTSLPLDQMAGTVLLPLAGVFTGMSFAWVGNAQSLLITDELSTLAKHAKGGPHDYIYSFQLAMLIILLALVWWGLAALGVFDGPCLIPCGPRWYELARGSSFFLLSLTIHASWSVVSGAQGLLLAHGDVKAIVGDGEDENTPGHPKQLPKKQP